MWFAKFGTPVDPDLRSPQLWAALFRKEDALEDDIEDPRSCKEHVRNLLRAIPPKGYDGEDCHRDARLR